MRTIPENHAAEAAVLAAVLIDPTLWKRISSEVVADDFNHAGHRAAFEAIGAVASRGDVVEFIGVGEEMRRRGTVGLLGGEGGLVELAGKLNALGDLPAVVGIVREKSRARRGWIALSDAAAALQAGELTSEVFESIAATISRLATGSATELVRLGEVLPDAIASLEDRQRRRANGSTEANGIRFGVNELDNATCSLQPGDQCVVAAETGGGKTALAVQCALTSTLVDGGTSIIFNLEMTKRQLAERALVHLGKVNSHLLRAGGLTYDDFKSLHKVAARVYEAPIYLEDRAFGLRDICARARAWRARHPDPRGVMVVDFLQLVRAEMQRGEGRVRELGRIAYAIKELAKELDVAAITVSQIRRRENQGEPPSKFDLKESGDIENSADQIALLWNPDNTDDGPVTCVLDKNRHGMKGKFNLHWTARHFVFSDVIEQQPQTEKGQRAWE